VTPLLIAAAIVQEKLSLLRSAVSGKYHIQ
jgi:hypothetical protein